MEWTVLGISHRDRDIPVQFGLGILSSLWSGLSWDYPRISCLDIPVQLGLGILCSLWSGLSWVYPRISCRDIPVQLRLRILCSLGLSQDILPRARHPGTTWTREFKQPLEWTVLGLSHGDIPVQLGLGILCSLWSGLSWGYPTEISPYNLPFLGPHPVSVMMPAL